MRFRQWLEANDSPTEILGHPRQRISSVELDISNLEDDVAELKQHVTDVQTDLQKFLFQMNQRLSRAEQILQLPPPQRHSA